MMALSACSRVCFQRVLPKVCILGISSLDPIYLRDQVRLVERDIEFGIVGIFDDEEFVVDRRCGWAAFPCPGNVPMPLL